MRTDHGGDWAGFYNQQGRMPLDFSASISPLGVPEGVQRAVRDAAARSDRYPDPKCRALRAALSEAEGVPIDRILCGNGAADLIYRIAFAARPRTGAVLDPSFSEYAAALSAAGCTEIRRIPLDPAWGVRLDEVFLDALTPDLDLLYLCQPNNPTGVSIPMALFRRILERCRENGIRLGLDLCFLDFLEDPNTLDAKAFLDAYPNLVIFRAFTKLYAMAGLRLGYALCGDPAFLRSMDAAGPPWNVSLIAQEAGIAALRERAYVQSLRALIARERPRLREGLEALGLRTVPGEANFLLFQSPVPLDEPLRRRGILIRPCGSLSGPDTWWYRTAVRTETDNQILLRTLQEILREANPRWQTV